VLGILRPTPAGPLTARAAAEALAGRGHPWGREAVASALRRLRRRGRVRYDPRGGYPVKEG
jgi:hypothetical protein